MQFIITQFIGGKGANKAGQEGEKIAIPKTVPAWEDRPREPVQNYNSVPQMIAPIWSLNSTLDIEVYAYPSALMPSLRTVQSRYLVMQGRNYTIGDYDDTREIDAVLEVPKAVQNNATWWGHFYVGLQGSTLDPKAREYDPSRSYHFARPLNQVYPKKRVVKTKNLLAGSHDNEHEAQDEQPEGSSFASYYHPNFTISMIPDSGTQSYPNMHPAVRGHAHLESTGARDASGQNGWYYPILFVNTFWQLKDHMTELNSTVKEVPIHISLTNLQNWKFSLYASIDEGMKQKARDAAQGGLSASGDGSEFEEFKRIMIDTNIYLLSTTAIVTLLHTVFEALAFKSDVSHWRQKKDNIGVSVRTILANILMQSIILLYLMDNREGTSWMILLGSGMGILIEAWKITKTVDVRIRPAQAGAWIPYAITFEDKHKLSETEEKTKEYDEIAFRYLYMVAVPLLLGYAIYSVVYETHKSWYSFVITTLVGSVYAYGFLMMVPSLYINYRLQVWSPILITTIANQCFQSVAHMPGRAMTYKFLNTFIDDLFAFTIKMPTLHRLATLRDDVIFFIYLYQAYKYKVDYSRVNEFGQGGDDEAVEEKTANKPLIAPPEADGKVDESVASKATGAEKGAAKKRR